MTNNTQYTEVMNKITTKGMLEILLESRGPSVVISWSKYDSMLRLHVKCFVMHHSAEGNM